MPCDGHQPCAQRTGGGGVWRHHQTACKTTGPAPAAGNALAVHYEELRWPQLPAHLCVPLPWWEDPGHSAPLGECGPGVPTDARPAAGAPGQAPLVLMVSDASVSLRMQSSGATCPTWNTPWAHSPRLGATHQLPPTVDDDHGRLPASECTSSGPSAKRSVRAWAYERPAGSRRTCRRRRGPGWPSRSPGRPCGRHHLDHGDFGLGDLVCQPRPSSRRP